MEFTDMEPNCGKITIQTAALGSIEFDCIAIGAGLTGDLVYMALGSNRRHIQHLANILDAFDDKGSGSMWFHLNGKEKSLLGNVQHMHWQTLDRAGNAVIVIKHRTMIPEMSLKVEGYSSEAWYIPDILAYEQEARGDAIEDRIAEIAASQWWQERLYATLYRIVKMPLMRSWMEPLTIKAYEDGRIVIPEPRRYEDQHGDTYDCSGVRYISVVGGYEGGLQYIQQLIRSGELEIKI